MGGMNWGAGLQTLGQALQQYAMLKYQEQEKAKEEDRQKQDRIELLNLTHPERTYTVGGGTVVAPGGQMEAYPDKSALGQYQDSQPPTLGPQMTPDTPMFVPPTEVKTRNYEEWAAHQPEAIQARDLDRRYKETQIDLLGRRSPEQPLVETPRGLLPADVAWHYDPSLRPDSGGGSEGYRRPVKRVDGTTQMMTVAEERAAIDSGLVAKPTGWTGDMPPPASDSAILGELSSNKVLEPLLGEALRASPKWNDYLRTYQAARRDNPNTPDVVDAMDPAPAAQYAFSAAGVDPDQLYADILSADLNNMGVDPGSWKVGGWKGMFAHKPTIEEVYQAVGAAKTTALRKEDAPKSGSMSWENFSRAAKRLKFEPKKLPQTIGERIPDPTKPNGFGAVDKVMGGA